MAREAADQRRTDRNLRMDVALIHILEDVLGIDETSVIFHQDEVYEILDLITMTSQDIKGIKGTINGNTTPLSKRDARLIIQFTWWYKDICNQSLESHVADDYWFSTTKQEFTEFRRTRAPALTNPTSTSQFSNPVQDGVVGAADVIQFRNSIKKEVSQYPEFKGSLEGWLPFKRKLRAIAATHGIERIVQDNIVQPIKDSQDYRLYEQQNTFLYSVFTQKLAGGPANLALRAYETNRDARNVFLRLKSHYESTTNLMVISQKCHARIQSLKLNRFFKGGAQAFVTQLQNAFLDLEYCTGTAKNDLEKKTTLLLAIEDDNYHSIRDNLAMDPSKDYHDSLAAIDQHATMFINTKTRRNNKTTTQEEKSNDGSKEKKDKKKKKPKDKGNERSINNLTKIGRAHV